MLISALAEPAMLMAVFTLAMSAHSTNLSSVVQFNLDAGLVLRPSFLFALLGLVLVAIAETGRIPVDNPATHLELTMIHEAMILEYSGRHLALMEWAAQLKLMLYGVLISSVFLPWGIATDLSLPALGLGLLAVILKLLLLGLLVAVAETGLAKMRLFRAPQYLNLAFLLTLLGLFSHVILETGP
jgi:formate hydrogenlyase subunit 4